MVIHHCLFFCLVTEHGVYPVRGMMNTEEWIANNTKQKLRHFMTGFSLWRCRLMAASGCAAKRDYDPHDPMSWDILRKVKPTLSPHFLRHNYVTRLYEGGVDLLTAMKTVGRTDCKTAANICTHVRDEMCRIAAVNMELFGAGNRDEPAVI